MTGCAPDVFLDAPLIRPSLQVEETCPATRTPIRLMCTPSGVESADPAGTVVPILPPQEFDRLEGIRSLTDIDASFCAQCPSAPPRRRLRDGWPLIPAAASSQSGRRGI